jgi:flagellar protein FlgJ
MTPLHADIATQQSIFTDLSSLDSIRQKGREQNTEAALRDIATQFESMLVRMMLKSMRDANAVFGKDSMMNSNETQFYQNMYDDQLTLSLSEGGGIGLADVMVRQLLDRSNIEPSSERAAPAEIARYHGSENSSQMAAVANITAPELSVSFDGSVEGFVKQLYPMAEKAAQQLGIEPSVLLAQAALETGWGEKITSDKGGKSSLNLFNIKADQRWQGEQATVSTLEYRDGVAVREQASFRAYSSLQQSFDDYVDFVIGSGRYQQALNVGDGQQYIDALHQGGYATDPYYAGKVMRIANSEKLQMAIVASHSGDQL